MKSSLIVQLMALCTAAVFFSVGEAAAASANRLAIVVPPDKSYVDGDRIDVVLRGGEAKFDEVQVAVNGRKGAVITKPSNLSYSCCEGVRLSYGKNRITISGLSNGRKAAEASAEVFYRSDLSPGCGTPPLGFRKYLFHTDHYEDECATCHHLDFSSKGEKTEGVENSPCYTCHKSKVSNYEFAHGPAAVWSCLTCHNAKSKNPKLSVAQPDSAICVDCHENSWDNAKYKHGPTAAGSCTVCHSPHASDKRYFLRADAFDLCASCHEDILYQPHVITSFTPNGGGHPLRRSPDPFHPTRDFGCASCHNPHGSDSQVLLNSCSDSTPRESFCRSCHRM